MKPETESGLGFFSESRQEKSRDFFFFCMNKKIFLHSSWNRKILNL